MNVYILRTAGDWEKANGAAVVIAESMERVEALLRDYEMEETLRCYESDNDAASDTGAPFRHTWVLLESLPTDQKIERVIISSWDEK